MYFGKKSANSLVGFGGLDSRAWPVWRLCLSDSNWPSCCDSELMTFDILLPPIDQGTSCLFVSKLSLERTLASCRGSAWRRGDRLELRHVLSLPGNRWLLLTYAERLAEVNLDCWTFPCFYLSLCLRVQTFCLHLFYVECEAGLRRAIHWTILGLVIAEGTKSTLQTVLCRDVDWSGYSLLSCGVYFVHSLRVAR